MKRILFRIGICLGGFVVLLFIVLLVITLIYGSRVKQIAVSQLNKELNTEVQVAGDVSFSVFAHFPSASITFNKVIIKETLPEKNDFLNCEKISLLFSIWNLFRSHYTVEKVTADHGTLRIRVDSTGKNNYDIFKHSDNASPDFSVKIRQAALQNFNVSYDDDVNQEHYSFNTFNSTLSGDFSQSKFSLHLNATAISDFLRSGSIDFLPQRHIKADGTIECNLSANEYIFKDADVEVNGNKFKVNGSMKTLEHGNDLRLKISSDELNLREIISLLPPEYAGKFSNLTADGRVHFNCEISGVQSPESSAFVTASFELNNCSISHQKVNKAFQHISLKGTFTNGSLHNLSSSQFTVQQFSTVIDGEPFHGNFMVQDFTAPSVDVLLDGRLRLANVYPLIHDSAIRSMDGVVSLHDCFFRGKLAMLSSSFDAARMNAGGKFELQNVKIATPQATYEKLNGRFEIKNNEIAFSNCSFTAGQSDLQIEGTVTNLIPFIFSSLRDSIRLKPKVGVNVTLNSHRLNWEDLVGKSIPNSYSTIDPYSIPEIFYWLAGSVNGNIDQFHYEKFNAAALHGNILFLPDKIYFNNIGLNAEDGNITAAGSINISKIRHSTLDMTAQLNRLNIAQLFFELNNFDQNALTDKNLKGTLTASVSLQSTWDDNRLNKNKLHAVADVSVENGELNNFEPMLALATFMKLKELRNIRFSKLQNQLEVKGLRVYIPTMQIYSNALNVQLSGTHGFDNVIDYKLQLNLLRLLTDKFRKSNASQEQPEQSTEGFLNLYLTMTGPAADPVIKYDKKAVKQKIATDLASEGKNLKQALRKEFNQQNDTDKGVKDYKSPGQIQYFEFEDSSSTSADAESNSSTTRQDQKKAFSDFKNIFHKPSPKKE